MQSLIAIGAAFFAAKRILRYLRFLQQEEGYNPVRFIRWFFLTKAFDLRGSAIALAAYFTGLSFPGALGLFALAYFEENPAKTGKVKLAWTNRSKRIFAVSILIYLLLLIPSRNWLWLFATFQLIPFILPLAVLLLAFDERRRQQKILKDAKAKFASIPFVIGITGSAGKTSTKEALGRLLQITLGPTFWPEKGINTQMGIAREIRQKLSSLHRFAVIEMGAYGKGSIQRLCKLTPPHAAIITEVGDCHLERFGSRETIRKTKGELAEALGCNSLLIVNGDNPLVRQIGIEHPDKRVLYYGFDKNNDTQIIRYNYTPMGTTFSLQWRGQTFQGKTPLLGKGALMNLAAAFTLATEIGADPEFAIAALSTLEPVNNRLHYSQQMDVGYLHDAYNSNPQGFATALEVLEMLPAKRRFLLTPGMIELGPLQHQLNQQAGKQAAAVCDWALVVNQINQKALFQGLKDGGMAEDHILVCNTRDEAFGYLQNLTGKGDLVLIENDLPDLYEARPKW